MVGMIFKPQNKSFRPFLTFRNKLTLLPLKTYVRAPLKVQRQAPALPVPQALALSSRRRPLFLDPS